MSNDETVSRKDITNQVEYGDVDSESMPITKCVCGMKYGAWDFIISIYKDDTKKCPKCGRELYFEQTIKVFERKR